jgi:hypothetical protein
MTTRLTARPLLAIAIAILIGCSSPGPGAPDSPEDVSVGSDDEAARVEFATTLDCSGLLDCLMDCDDSECRQSCKDDADVLVQLAHDTLVECSIIYCDNLADGSMFDRCVEHYCPYERVACLESTPSASSPVGVFECDEVFDCAIDCFGDRDCEKDCSADGTLLGRRGFFHLRQCLQWHCPDAPADTIADDDCAHTHCPGELYACLGPPTGTWSCLELFHCTMDCADEICRRDCFNQGTAESQEHFLRVLDCSSLACSSLHSTGLVAECHAEACAAEFDACLDPDHL